MKSHGVINIVSVVVSNAVFAADAVVVIVVFAVVMIVGILHDYIVIRYKIVEEVDLVIKIAIFWGDNFDINRPNNDEDRGND